MPSSGHKEIRRQGERVELGMLGCSLATSAAGRNPSSSGVASQRDAARAGSRRLTDPCAAPAEAWSEAAEIPGLYDWRPMSAACARGSRTRATTRYRSTVSACSGAWRAVVSVGRSRLRRRLPELDCDLVAECFEAWDEAANRAVGRSG